VLLACFALVLGWTLLPSTRILVLLVAAVAGITWLSWWSFIRIYAKGQAALEETLAQPPAARDAPPHSHPPPTLPAILREADLETIKINGTSPAAGKLIRELQLRSVTGASIVGLERAGATLINPGPDEELQAGDEVLILGSRQQLDSARAMMERRES
jgi:CPA2 family monovalent cation:H+ antiporter-2